MVASNYVTSSGAKFLAYALQKKNSSLSKLLISIEEMIPKIANNKVGNQGVMRLLKALKRNCAIMELHVGMYLI